MDQQELRIPKVRIKTSMWIHPEGLVQGSLFLCEKSPQHEGEEDPVELLNQDAPFVVFQCDSHEQIRFYNRSSIIRVEYEYDSATLPLDVQAISCQLHMMDGSLVSGTIREDLPEDHARLFDYLNNRENRFVRIFTSNSDICLINKSYIIKVTTSDM